MIPYGRQSIAEDDIAAVVKVLQSDFLTQGPKVVEFEKAICEYTGAKHCVSVANGTAALHIAVAALDLPAGSEGITSPNTFAASANSMAFCGVKPVFADIDPTSFNISPAAISARINSKTRLLTPVHFAGQPCDMEKISVLAKRHQLRVIEDAAHAIGSKYCDGGVVGNCANSDMTIFSFHPVKTITTGEGGAVMTNDPALYQKLLYGRSHGITKDPSILEKNPGPWWYEMHELGFNYRITDIQAALGITQLAKLERFCARRREIVAAYNEGLGALSWLSTPRETSGVRSCFHLYVAQIEFAAIGKNRAQVMNELRSKGVGTQVHYIPVHMQPWYRKSYGYGAGDCPNSETYYEKALSLPLYPAMTDADVRTVIDAVRGLAG
jgi:UDP-4-amino-4,6-dideoxy-N-acetyl-beta-L-altrosamine transaminase